MKKNTKRKKKKIHANTNDPITDAKLAAKYNSNGCLWFFTGCTLGPIGITLATIVSSSPPKSQLVGKSSRYVAIYISNYKKKTKKLRIEAAGYGCLTEAIALGLLYALTDY